MRIPLYLVVITCSMFFTTNTLCAHLTRGLFLIASPTQYTKLTQLYSATHPTASATILAEHLAKSHLHYHYSDAKLLALAQDFDHITQQANVRASTHIALYHGTLTTNLLLVQTLLTQLQTRRRYEHFWLLRDMQSTKHVRNVPSAYKHAMNLIRQRYCPERGLDRFDNDRELKKILLSANMHILANFEQQSNEDSMSFLLESNTRFKPYCLHDAMQALLSPYKLSGQTEYELMRTRGALLQILLPKQLAHLGYLSYPFGIPVNLPLSDLLCGELSSTAAMDILNAHQEVPLQEYNAKESDEYQARILLDPTHFHNPTSGIQMNLFVYQDQDEMHQLNSAINALTDAYHQKAAL